MRHLLPLLIAPLLTACKDAGSPDTGGCPVPEGACPFEEVGVFHSVEDLECGLGPDGPVLCSWTIVISEAGGWTWSYSDVGESGGWSCASGPSAFRSSGDDIAVSWDDAACLLTWDGVVYAPG